MVNVELPDSWEKVNLGNALSYIGNGLTDKQNKVKDGYPVTRIETISDDCINADKVGYISTLPEDKIEKYRLYYGDMLVSHINSDPQLGRSVIYEGNPEFLLHGMNLLRMRANTKMLAPFFLNLIFRFYRNCGVFIALASRAVGQSSINQSRMKSLIIPLPPLPEQRAIAHVLQTIQEAKAARQHELSLERERKAALMNYLFSYGTKGELRKETEIGEIPESWEVVKLDELCDLIQYGTSRRCNTDKGGVPVLRIPNIVGGKVDIADLKFMEPSEREFQSLLLEVGDLLFVRTNGRKEYTGRCAVFQGEFQESLFASYLIRVRLKSDTALPEFVQLYTMTPRGRSYLSGRASNAADGKFNINTQTIKSVLLPLPDSLEQCEIVETCRAFDIKIAALEQEAERLDELFHAMLDELMTGQRSAVPLIDTESSN